MASARSPRGSAYGWVGAEPSEQTLAPLRLRSQLALPAVWLGSALQRRRQEEEEENSKGGGWGPIGVVACV